MNEQGRVILNLILKIAEHHGITGHGARIEGIEIFADMMESHPFVSAARHQTIQQWFGWGA